MSDTTATEKAAAAEKAAAEKKAPAEKKAAEKAGVKLSRGEETVTAYKPATVTDLKSQGWKVAE